MRRVFNSVSVRSSVIIAIPVIMQFAAPSALGAIRYVDRSATGPVRDGVSWCSAFTELQDAIAVALPGDQIRVAGGVYPPDRGAGGIAGDRTATFLLASNVTWHGGYAGCGSPNPNGRDFVADETVLDGDLLGDDATGFVNYDDNSFHIVTYSDPNASGVVLDGFTVRGGNADGTGLAGITNQGGGVHIRNGSNKCLPGGPVIRDCVIRENWQFHHGAVNDHGLSTVIEGCTFIGNHSELEGGALQIHSGSPTVTDTVFLDNSSGGQGGAVWTGVDTDPTCAVAGAGSPTLVDCKFDGNSSDDQGGAMYNTKSSPTLRGCEFRNNTAFEQGGAIYDFEAPSPRFTDCLFEGNAANGGGEPASITGSGGAVYNWKSSPVFTSCVFRNNEASKYAGAVTNVVSSHAKFDSCHFEGNFASRRAGGLDNATQSEVLFIRSTFVANRAGQGGGAIATAGTATLTIINCAFRDNQAGVSTGGALFSTAVVERPS